MKNNELEELLDYISDRVIGKEKWNKVRDYITNLQQENNNLKTSLDESQEVVIDLQQENDDLKGRLENAVADCNLRLQEFKDYKSRIEKALHLITHSDITDYRVFDEELLNILNGGSDE